MRLQRLHERHRAEEITGNDDMTEEIDNLACDFRIFNDSSLDQLQKKVQIIISEILDLTSQFRPT